MASLDSATAYDLAAKLVTIRGAPRTREAIDAIAEDLLRWMKRDIRLDAVVWTPLQQAQWVVTEARDTWEEWEGTKALHELWMAKFYPAAVAPERRVYDLGKRPSVDCAACQDFGTITEKGSTRWCECRQAQTLYREEPDLVDRMNTKSRPIRVENVPGKLEKITAEDVARVEKQRANPKNVH